MFKNSIIIPVLLLCTLMFSACSDDPASVGVDVVKKDLVEFGLYDSFIDTVNQYDRSFVKVLPLGSSQMLLLGKNSNNEATTLVKFYLYLSDEISADLDSIQIISSKISLTPYYVVGDSTKPFDFTAHKVTYDWAYSTFSYDSLGLLTYDAANVSSNLVKDTTYTFDIEKDLASAWLKNAKEEVAGANYGLYLKPKRDTEHFRGFYGYSSLVALSLQPTLTIIVEKAGSYTDTLVFYTQADMHFVSGDNTLLPKKYTPVQSGVTINSAFWFDVSSLPADASVNKAELILTYDSLTSVLGTTYTDGLIAYYMSDSTNNTYDSDGYAVLTKSDDKYTGNIATIINRMLKARSNNGIVVTPRTPLEGMELFAIHNHQSSEPAKKPRLILHYTYTKKN